MLKGLQTRESIIGEGLRQATRLGLEGLSLGPIADSLKLSKSGLFAHFKSKEALQLQIMDEALGRFKSQVIAPGFPREAAGKRLRSLFERYLVWIRGTSQDGGCLFLTTTQEYDDRPGPIRDLLSSSQAEWRAYLAGIVREGIAAQEFRDDTDAEQVVFEIIGAALAYQHASKLLDDPRAKSRAQAAFARVLQSITIA